LIPDWTYFDCPGATQSCNFGQNGENVFRGGSERKRRKKSLLWALEMSAKRKRMEVGEPEQKVDMEESHQDDQDDDDGKVLLDVLPYIDPYTEEEKQAALRLIQEEMATFEPKDYLASLPPPLLPPFLGGDASMLQAEVERVGAGKPPAGGFDGARYQHLHFYFIIHLSALLHFT